MKWLKRVAIVAGVLLVMLAMLPLFISLNDYLPQIETEVSARLKEPVTIKSLRVAALPLPHLTVDGITIGKTEDIKVGKVTVTPDLLSLLVGPVKIIRNVEIDGLVLTQKAIDRIPVWARSDGSSAPAQVRVETIRLDDALLKLENVSFGPFDARVRLSSKGDAHEVSINTRDGKVKATVKPDKSNYLIDATAKSWKLPLGPAIVFDELTIKGIATLNDANLSQVSARLYGGTVNGTATIGWQKGMQLKGNFVVNQVELKQLAPLLSSAIKVSGRLSAKPVLSASAAKDGQLAHALRLETPFTLHNGVLHGVDIQKAATSLIRKDTRGGETHFDEFSGHLVMERSAYRLTKLKISSGVLAADGNVNISSGKELSGRLNTQVKAVGTSAGVPLNISGTLDSPLLFPTGGTIAGAAVGTAVLGPGVGTSVGAKLGGWAEDLFGTRDKKK